MSVNINTLSDGTASTTTTTTTNAIAWSCLFRSSQIVFSQHAPCVRISCQAMSWMRVANSTWDCQSSTSVAYLKFAERTYTENATIFTIKIIQRRFL